MKTSHDLLELLENEFSNFELEEGELELLEEGIIELLEEGGEFSLDDLRAIIEIDDEELLEAIIEFLETQNLIKSIDDYNYLVKADFI